MNIESTNDNNSTNTAITYSECYAQVFLGDCLEQHEHIKSGSVDLILTDLPYGNMKGINNPQRPKSWGNKEYLKWDEVIEPSIIYEIANRTLRKNGKMILFSQQPYTTTLITKQIPNLPHSYNMIWEKNDFANALLCNKAPVSFYEDILVFSKMNPKHDLELKHPIRKWLKDTQEKVGIFAVAMRDYGLIITDTSGGGTSIQTSGGMNPTTSAKIGRAHV